MGDGVVLAQFAAASVFNVYAPIVSRVLASPGWATVTADRLVVDDGATNMCILIGADSLRIYVAVTKRDYPSRCMYNTSDGCSSGFLHGENL
jgi:hypothetical protein